SQARLVIADQLLHAADDLALADRAAHVRADVLVGRELAVAAEHADRGAFDLHDLAARIGEHGCLADGDALHASSPRRLFAQPQVRSPRRYHMARSNRLMSAVRSSSLTTSTISVGVILSAATGAGHCPSASALAA